MASWGSCPTVPHGELRLCTRRHMHPRPPSGHTHHLTLYLSTGIITIGRACATKTSGARDDPCSESRKKGTAGAVGKRWAERSAVRALWPRQWTRRRRLGLEGWSASEASSSPLTIDCWLVGRNEMVVVDCPTVSEAAGHRQSGGYDKRLCGIGSKGKRR